MNKSQVTLFQPRKSNILTRLIDTSKNNESVSISNPLIMICIIIGVLIVAVIVIILSLYIKKKRHYFVRQEAVNEKTTTA